MNIYVPPTRYERVPNTTGPRKRLKWSTSDVISIVDVNKILPIYKTTRVSVCYGKLSLTICVFNYAAYYNLLVLKIKSYNL